MKRLISSTILLLLLSCGVTVNYDYEKETDFTQYKTYHYFHDMKTGLSELDSKRFFRMLDQAMASKGYKLSETPDFIIDIESVTFQSTQSPTVGVGAGTMGGGVSVGIPIGQAKVDRQIIYEFVEGKTHKTIWRAVSIEPKISENTPEEREAQFKAVIGKVLEGFPPKRKK